MNGEREQPGAARRSKRAKGATTRARARGACGHGSPLFLDLAHFSMFVDSYPDRPSLSLACRPSSPRPPPAPTPLILRVSSSSPRATRPPLRRVRHLLPPPRQYLPRTLLSRRTTTSAWFSRSSLGASENRESQGSSGQAARCPSINFRLS